jgi:hypothetical protein
LQSDSITSSQSLKGQVQELLLGIKKFLKNT